jgi:hypothetical protein
MVRLRPCGKRTHVCSELAEEDAVRELDVRRRIFGGVPDITAKVMDRSVTLSLLR